MPRKPVLPTLDVQVSIKFTRAQLRDIDRRALAAGKRTSAWIRDLALAALAESPKPTRARRRPPVMAPPELS